jgi:hypothetical protein
MLNALRKNRAMGNFAMGLGSCIALSGGFYNRTGRTVYTSNREMLNRDWFVVGADMRNAASRVMSEGRREHV